jgi:hypothetical protein
VQDDDGFTIVISDIYHHTHREKSEGGYMIAARFVLANKKTPGQFEMIKEANGNSAQLFVETSLVPEYIQIFSPPPAALTCCECTTSVKPRFTSVKKNYAVFHFIFSRALLRLLERNEAPAERETVVDSETYIAAFLFAEGGNLVPNNEVVANIFAADDNFRL